MDGKDLLHLPTLIVPILSGQLQMNSRGHDWWFWATFSEEISRCYAEYMETHASSYSLENRWLRRKPDIEGY